MAEDHKQKDVDLVHYCLKYDNAAMNCWGSSWSKLSSSLIIILGFEARAAQLSSSLIIILTFEARAETLEPHLLLCLPFRLLFLKNKYWSDLSPLNVDESILVSWLNDSHKYLIEVSWLNVNESIVISWL